MQGQQPRTGQEHRRQLSRQPGDKAADQHPGPGGRRRVLGRERGNRAGHQPQDDGHEHGRAPDGHHHGPDREPSASGHRGGQDGRRQPAILLPHGAPGQGGGAGRDEDPAVADDHGEVGLDAQLVAEEGLHGRVVGDHLLEGALDGRGEDAVGQAEGQTAHHPPGPGGGARAQGQPQGARGPASPGAPGPRARDQPLAQLAPGVQGQARTDEDDGGAGQQSQGLPAQVHVHAALLDEADGGQPGQEGGGAGTAAARAPGVAQAAQQEPGQDQHEAAPAGGAGRRRQGRQDQSASGRDQGYEEQPDPHHQAAGRLQPPGQGTQGAQGRHRQGGQGRGAQRRPGAPAAPHGGGAQQLARAALLVPAGARDHHEHPHEGGHEGQPAQGLGGEERAHGGGGRVHAEAGAGEDGGRGGRVAQGGGPPLLGRGVHGVEHGHAVEGQRSAAQGPGQDAAPLPAQDQAGQWGDHGPARPRPGKGGGPARAHEAASSFRVPAEAAGPAGPAGPAEPTAPAEPAAAPSSAPSTLPAPS